MFCPNYPFFKGNLHTHTTLSDGDCTVAQMEALYAAAGYDFVAVTDHERVYDGAGDKLLLLRGIELGYTLPQNEVVHLVGIGFAGEVTHGDTPQAGIDSIRAQGGLAILAHPAWSLNSTQTICDLQGLFAAEIYNSVSAAPLNPMRAESGGMLDAAYRMGAHMGLVASDDTHRYRHELFGGYTMVNAAACTAEAVLEGLRAGRYYASQGPQFVQIDVREGCLQVQCSPCNMICVHNNRAWSPGRAVLGEGISEFSYPITAEDRVLRVEILDACGKRAWSRPLFWEDGQWR